MQLVNAQTGEQLHVDMPRLSVHNPEAPHRQPDKVKPIYLLVEGIGAKCISDGGDSNVR